MSGLDRLLDGVEWEQLGDPGGDRTLPFATHQGWLQIGGTRLKCYQLSDGRRVFAAEDVEEMFGFSGGGTITWGEGPIIRSPLHISVKESEASS